MNAVELKISKKDWIYISTIGTLFGFFISLFFYFLNDKFANQLTIVFGTITAFIITLFAVVFISLSNNYILPSVNKRFWYFISFIFSFLSGAIGFLFSYTLFYIFEISIINTIKPYSLYLTLSIGSLTFLIGLILHQFISMKYRNEHIKNEILDSKLKALESELNPHFLFNALNSMSELVYIDQQKAEQSILNLSKFLRNAIKTDSIIDINDELEMVKNYVNIENIRFDNRIKLHIHDINQNNFKVPKFSIQLLVENAIKHGYENKELNIFIKIDDNIIVSNDGRVTKSLKYGTGLKNLNNRLKLLKIGKLHFEQTEMMQFKIEVYR
jgi:sensor histidine kinase YesM